MYLRLLNIKELLFFSSQMGSCCTIHESATGGRGHGECPDMGVANGLYKPPTSPQSVDVLERLVPSVRFAVSAARSHSHNS